ncbi:MAG: hypothetical protein HXY52_01435 [Nitrospirae bacterium]|jgi:hypothetical protein|nr:hypothetical protein [Nitrospirota bacterium]
MSNLITKLKSKKEFLYIASILIILITINFRILNTWFIIDDTANIFCSSFDTINLLFDKGTYLYFNQLFFTPLLPISFKLDWILFKMNPLGYHLINLFVAFLCCLMFYKLQRIYFTPFASWIGTIVMSISLPMSFDISWVTRKHYLWGFFFTLTAIYFFKSWEENKKKYLLLFSLITTLISFLFKEAYAYLPALVFVISAGSISDRAKNSTPYFLILIVYIFWRIHILGGIGGYPGSIEKSFVYLFNKLLYLPVNLSKNLYGLSYFPFLFFIILAFLDYKWLIFLILIIFIVISPFIFYPAEDFLLANKALSFVAVFSFILSYISNKLLKHRKIYLLIFFLFLIPALFGSISKIRLSQNAVIQLSSNYKKASDEILKNSNEKILVIGNYSYYFSNLEDIYKKMLKKDFPYIKSISDTVVLPYLDKTDFDKIILTQNLNLEQDIAFESDVKILTGSESKQFILENLKSKNFSNPPDVNFTPTSDHVIININDSRKGTYLRCLYMGTYVGCYPIPKKYLFKFNKVKHIDRIDIIFLSENGIPSKPSSFVLQK